MVVAEVQMGESMFSECKKMFGLPTEDVSLEHRSLHLRGRTLQVAHHDMGCRKQGVDALREESIDPFLLDETAHAAIQKDVTGKEKRSLNCLTHSSLTPNPSPIGEGSI